MENQLLDKVINKKKKELQTFRLEQAGIAGFISGFVGLVLGEFYSVVLDSLLLHVLNVFLYAAIGVCIGYISSRARLEEMEVEIMLLENFKEQRKR